MSTKMSSKAAQAPIVEEQLDDGGSGACPHGHGQVDAQTSKFRLSYLAFNAAVTVLLLVTGIVTFEMTNSLSVMLDWLKASVDLLALFINFAVEVMKMRAKSERTILILDLVGCTVSIALLLGITLFGLVDAIHRAEKVQAEHVSNLQAMVIYSSASMVCDFIILFAYGFMKERMSPGVAQDELNMMSSLLHVASDLLVGAAVFGTAIWLRHANFNGEDLKDVAWHKTAIDAVGACVVCAFILVAVVFCQQHARETLQRIRDLDAPTPSPESSALDHSAMEGTADYGTMSGDASDQTVV